MLCGERSVTPAFLACAAWLTRAPWSPQDTLWKQEGQRTPTSFYKVAKFALPVRLPGSASHPGLAAGDARPETMWLCAGQRWYLLIDLAVAIKCFGVGCSYLVVIGDLMPEAMHQLAPAATLLHQVRSHLCSTTRRWSRVRCGLP